VLLLLGRDPRQLSIDRTRWTLASLRTVCPWLELTTDSGLHHLLDRLAITYTRARDHIHSPDPAYDAKRRWIGECQRAAHDSQGRIVTLLEDEVTIYRQPSVAPAWGARGTQAQAERAYRSNTVTRIAATLDVTDGRVLYRRTSAFSVAEMVAFYQQLVAAYPQAERLYLILDNWPVHFHADVLCALEPQISPYPWHRLPVWSDEPHPQAYKAWGDLALPIQLVPLPTYASWLNPIEKLWRKLKQEVIHLHRSSTDLAGLRALIDAFLDRFAHGSADLLSYVGLSVPV
jgi:transposase